MTTLKYFLSKSHVHSKYPLKERTKKQTDKNVFKFLNAYKKLKKKKLKKVVCTPNTTAEFFFKIYHPCRLVSK